MFELVIAVLIALIIAPVIFAILPFVLIAGGIILFFIFLVIAEISNDKDS